MQSNKNKIKAMPLSSFGYSKVARRYSVSNINIKIPVEITFAIPINIIGYRDLYVYLRFKPLVRFTNINRNGSRVIVLYIYIYLLFTRFTSLIEIKMSINFTISTATVAE